MISAREAALNTLYEIFYEGAYSNLALKKMLRKCNAMKDEEKRLLTNLVYGVVSYHFTLEYVIKKYSSVKPKKIAKYIHLILELGLYQLMYADKIPESAAVNESVKLAKRYGKSGSDRFVNAILRSFCRDGCEIAYPTDKASYLSVKYSYTLNMTKTWIDDFGYDTAEELMQSLNAPPPLMLRANTLKITADELCKRLENEEGIHARPVTVLKKAGDSFTDDGTGALLEADGGFDIAQSKLCNEGFFSVQDKGAYCASVVLAPKSGETVIDMCAAPGGKTTHIAELMGDRGKIIACDIHEHKIKLIESSLKRLGVSCVSTLLRDSSVCDETLLETADRVLCDVPCSGWGIIRRKPDIKLENNDISALPPLQLKILLSGASYVKKGGCIVYSTCTINRRENEEVVNAFLESAADFEKSYEKTFYPNRDNSDGFYICRLNRK
jgi:16S rRNA (cytosine967-C5)-methyltransferase